jgi:hypothetical protein
MLRLTGELNAMKTAVAKEEGGQGGGQGATRWLSQTAGNCD